MTQFAVVSAERATHAGTTLCGVIGVRVSGLYAGLQAIPAIHRRAAADAEWRERIGRIFPARRRVDGSPRIPAERRRAGRRHSRRRVERLRRELGLSARHGRHAGPRTTNSRHAPPIAPNRLERNFTADSSHQVWLADLSYIPSEEGWLYLAAIKDMAPAGSSAGPWPIT